MFCFTFPLSSYQLESSLCGEHFNRTPPVSESFFKASRSDDIWVHMMRSRISRARVCFLFEHTCTCVSGSSEGSRVHSFCSNPSFGKRTNTPSNSNGLQRTSSAVSLVPSQQFFNLVSATFSVPLIYDKGSFLDILKPITSTCHCWDCDPLHVFWRRLLRLHLTSFCCIFPINPFFCSPGMFFQNLSDSSYHLFQGLRREIFYFLGPFWFTVGSVFTRILDQIGVNVH